MSPTKNKSKHKDSMPDPYAQGQDAAHTNKSQCDCPYDYSTPEGEQWVQGYQDGGGED